MLSLRLNQNVGTAFALTATFKANGVSPAARNGKGNTGQAV